MQTSFDKKWVPLLKRFPSIAVSQAGSVLCPRNAFCIVSLAATFPGGRSVISPLRGSGLKRDAARQLDLGPNQPSDPPKARPTLVWSEPAGSAQTHPGTHWTCVVVAAGDVSGQKSVRSAPESGQRRGQQQERGRAGSAAGRAEAASDRWSGRSCPLASRTYIKVTSTSLIKR